MLAFKLILFALVISNGVLGRDTRRRSTSLKQAEDEYKYNHPPTPQEAIPVAVVYENESNREDKSITGDITPDKGTDDVSTEPQSKLDSDVKPESTSTVKVSNDEIELTKPSNVEEKELKVTTYRPQIERHIPVAVVYDPEPTYQKPISNRNRATNKRKRIQEPAVEEKHTEEEEDNTSFTPQVNGHTGPLIPSANRNVDLDKRRKHRRPVVEKQTVATPILNGTIFTLSKHLSIETEMPSNFHKPTNEEAKVSHGKEISTNPIVNKHEQLNTQDEIQRVKSEIKISKDSKKRPSIIEDKNNLIVKADKARKPNTDHSEQFKRDNSTRVREVIPIVQSENVVFSHSGNFKYSYEGGDGTKAFEAGELKTFDDETAGEAVSGGFSYTAKDGNEYSLSYTADENGYRPVGAHLPTPPPIPPAIARALAYLATKTTPEPVTESLAEDDA
ncbi:uncharacterized protein LOC125226302 [Leguminivora glycinivorella]|uniref:uncharacterized protein LOC125226302 n=1 Tax=Leguminivora glycinivorella TaxID=1035111 RepID=UPI00200FA8DA|nr:uncharacterized protein LOC125226302 [Leguminivora glycinivorella]